jgi:hypothetical protein
MTSFGIEFGFQHASSTAYATSGSKVKEDNLLPEEFNFVFPKEE